MRIRYYLLLCCALGTVALFSAVTADSAAEVGGHDRLVVHQETFPAYSGPTTDLRQQIFVAVQAAQYTEAAHRAAEQEQRAAARQPVARTYTATVASDEAPSAAPTGDMVDLIYSIFGNNARAVKVAQCESGLSPTIRNRSGASGLFQIVLPLHNDLFAAHGWNASTDWSDPFKNATIAFEMSGGGSSWGPWSESRHCWG